MEDTQLAAGESSSEKGLCKHILQAGTTVKLESGKYVVWEKAGCVWLCAAHATRSNEPLGQRQWGQHAEVGWGVWGLLH